MEKVENLDNAETQALNIPVVRRSYLDKVKDDLIVSKKNFNKCRKYSEKWKFYRDHIEWLETEIDKTMENGKVSKVSKVAETQQLNIFAVSTRLFGVYDRNGNIKTVYREPYNAFEEATKLNRQLVKDEYFIDWVIVG